METLQLAQMLADLSDLNAADPHAANALVSANKKHQSQDAPVASVDASGAATPTPAPQRPPHKRVASASAATSAPSPGSAPLTRTTSHTGSSTPFDAYLGRRLLTPPISRTSSNGSVPGTPRGEDADVDRASSLIALYELRAKLKQYNDSNSLRQARDKITALSARQQQAGGQPQSPTSAPSASTSTPTNTSSPQASSNDRRHSQYTYPRT